MNMATTPGLDTLTVWGAFALGLTGGFGHCLMMCGPFVVGASLGTGANKHDVRRAWVFQSTYHAGRIITYTVLGGLLGALGGSGAISRLSGAFSPLAITKYLKLSAGAVLLVMGTLLFISYVRKGGARSPGLASALMRFKWYARATSALTRSGGAWGLPLGMLMGLMPCMPIVPAEIAALGTSEPLTGALVMAAFGLGTVPALAGFGAVSGLIGAQARGWLLPASAAVMAGLGAVTVVQGVLVVAG